jgi:Zn-dependent protease
VHEISHGYAAYKLGDNTAKFTGRLSLNPLRHIDPIGFLCILLVGFGWAKPVMVNPYNLKNPKVDMALIAAAGPISNFIMAFLASFIYVYLWYAFFPLNSYVKLVLENFLIFNLTLGVFNLIPFPPLDGSKIVMGIMPRHMYEGLPQLGPWGMIILMLLIFSGVVRFIIFPFVNGLCDLFLMIAENFLSFLSLIPI